MEYITDYLVANAQNCPDKAAIIYEDSTINWSELAERVESSAAIIAPKLPNDSQAIVGLLMQNSPEFIVAYLAVIHAGHIAMPLDPNFKPLEVRSVLDSMHIAFTISNYSYDSFFNSTDQVLFAEDFEVAADTADNSAYLRLGAENQVASMLFTSGTTGNPKSVPYTHRNHMWNITAVSELWQWTAEDTILLSLPLSHWHGLVMGLDGALYHGNTIYLQKWFEPQATFDLLTSGKITLCMHVPIVYSKLVAYEPNQEFDVSSVRLFISGSSFMPPKIWHQFKARFGVEILERYGANEMGLIASNFLDQRIPGSVGVPLKDVSIRIMDHGEIAMKSPGLFPGYWHNDEATAKQRLDDGYWLSGDIGELDDDGRLWLKGRVQEKMKKYGFTVYPRDLEWALLKHEAIHEVVVMSVQNDDQLSDTFVYFVVGDIEDDEIFAYAKAQMPYFWQPDKIVHLDTIPKTGRTSKPALKELRALLDDVTL